MEKFKTKEDIKTFEDACEYLGDLALIPNLDTMPEKYRKPLFAHYKLCIIAEAINTIENKGKHWTPDWENRQSDKYYPWFCMASSSGVGFSFDGDVSWRTVSDCSSRLCFISRAAAIYAGEQFESLYKEYFVME